MNETQILDFARDGVWILLLVSAPLLIVATVVGLGVALFQTLTSLQDMTLTFVPKMVAVFIVFLIFLPNMIRVMTEFMLQVMDTIVGLP